MRILVADDSPVFRDVLKAMLHQWGYEVTSVNDGDEAWQVLGSADSPRLAILDWMMPGMDGLEVCRKVRERGQPVYIIILTAKTEPQDLLTAMDAGTDDYLTKPLKSAELRLRLRTACRVLDLQEQVSGTK